MLLRFWKTILMSLILSVFASSMAMAATQYPSVAGTWAIEGKQKISAKVKGFGGGSDSQPYQGTAKFYPDHTFINGTWQQTKQKITFIFDEADMESMLNSYLHSASGEYDIYVSITKASGQATISKDGNKLTGGKAAFKFTIDGTISGKDITGSGSYSESFKGFRTSNIAAASTDSSTDVVEEETSELVKSFAKMLVDTYLKKNK